MSLMMMLLFWLQWLTCAS